MKRIRLIRSNEITRGNQREVEVGKEKNALDQVRVRFSHFRLFVYLCTIPHFRYFYLLRSVVRGFSKKIRQNWNFRREARAQRGRDNKRQKKLILSTNYGIILTSVIQRYNKEYVRRNRLSPARSDGCQSAFSVGDPASIVVCGCFRVMHREKQWCYVDWSERYALRTLV